MKIQVHCSGLDENGPQAHVFEQFIVRQWHYLRRIRCGLAGGSVSIAVDFEVSKALLDV